MRECSSMVSTMELEGCSIRMGLIFMGIFEMGRNTEKLLATTATKITGSNTKNLAMTTNPNLFPMEQDIHRTTLTATKIS